jgi:hypothetical protein
MSEMLDLADELRGSVLKLLGHVGGAFVELSRHLVGAVIDLPVDLRRTVSESPVDLIARAIELAFEPRHGLIQALAAVFGGDWAIVRIDDDRRVDVLFHSAAHQHHHRDGKQDRPKSRRAPTVAPARIVTARPATRRHSSEATHRHASQKKCRERPPDKTEDGVLRSQLQGERQAVRALTQE